MTRSRYELLFEVLLTEAGIDGFETEYRFTDTRKWRLDFAWPALKIAVEIDGGQWHPGGGRHGGDADRDKLNHAAADGWRILHFSPVQITDAPSVCIGIVRRALG